MEDIEKLKLKLQEDRKNIINDPFRKIKEKANARKARRAKRKSRNKAEKTKARRDLTKKVVSNAAKTLAPIIALPVDLNLENTRLVIRITLGFPTNICTSMPMV